MRFLDRFICNICFQKYSAINISNLSYYLASGNGVEYMANVIVMQVPKDKLQQEIECKIVDDWKLRNDENIIPSISVTDIVFDDYFGKWNTEPFT